MIMPSTIRVLHVDDEPEFAELSADFIERHHDDIEVVTATSMQEALASLDEDLDCIVSDYEMPEGTGIELLQHVRGRDPDLPFILFTGKGSEEIASDAISAGVTDYLQKRPGREQYEILANRIDHAVERHRARSNYREMFEKVPDPVVLHELPTGTILDANQQCCVLFGYDREEMLGIQFDDLQTGISPYTADRGRKLLRQAEEEGQLTFEWRIRRQDGEVVPVEVHLSKTTIDGHDRVMAAIRDISVRKERQRELERAYDRMEVALDVTTAAIWEWDVSTDDVTVHPAIHPVFQTRISTSDGYLERIHPDDRATVRRALEHTVETGDPFQVLFRTEVDGETRWVEDYGEWRQHGETEQVLVGVSREITEHKRREQMLADERDRLSGLISTIPEPVVQVKMTDGEPIIQAVNRAYEDTFGVEAAEALGRSNNEFVVPEGHIEEARRIDSRILEGKSVVQEVQRQTVDGINDFLLRSVPVGTNGKDTLDCFVIYIDISEQKQRQADLEELKQRYQAYVEHTNDVIVVLDEDRSVTYVSPAVEEMTGRLPVELAGSTLREYIHPEDRPTFESLCASEDTGTATGYAREEFRVRSEPDDWLWVEAIVSRQDDGSYVINARDISTRKRRERERDRNERYRQQLYQVTSDPTLGPHETIDELLSLGCACLGISCGYIARIDPALDEYEVIRVVGDGVEEGLQTNPDQTYCRHTLEADNIFTIGAASEEGFVDHPAFTEHGIGSYIGGQLIVDDDQFGTVCFIDPDERSAGFTTENEAFVELVSRWISHILDRIHREQVITDLHQVATELSRCDTKEEVYELTIDVAESLLDFDRSGIAIAHQGKLHVVAMSEELDLDETPTMDVDEGVAGLTYQRGESYLIRDITDFEVAVPQLEIGSAISIPISDVGIFQVISEVPEAFDERDLALAELLVRHTENALSRLERERELRRHNERLEQFSNVLSHDLRNPLNVATGHIELLRGERGDDEVVERIANAIDRMDDIIDGTLSLARRGEMVTRSTSVELERTARQSWGTVSSGNATLEVVDELTIEADPDPLRHVLENLFRNAVDHGGRDVCVTVGRLDGGGFYIEDNGGGIEEEDKARVFDVGYSTHPEGTGFGLSIVKELVDAHGWTISITEGDTGGARFEVTNVSVVD